MNEAELRRILSEIDSTEVFNIDNSFEYARICSIVLADKKKSEYAIAERITIHILNKWDLLPDETKPIWGDIAEAVGFYPYIERDTSMIGDSLADEMRLMYHKSEYLPNIYMHCNQKKLSNTIFSGQNVIVSAPTSFGKSLLIEEIVASNKFRNIVIIQPTLALLDETRKKLQKYNQSYKIIVRTTQEPSTTKRNLFLFTAERVCEYSYFENVDFLVIDEFYKLSGKRDDERSSALNNAFYKLLKLYNPQFYLLGPNIDSVSEGFTQKYNAIFYKSKYSLVDSNVIDIYNNNSKGASKNREIKLFDLLISLSNEQTIIYCSSPDRVRSLSYKFYLYLRKNATQIIRTDLPIIEWISKNISKRWSVNNVLSYGIGIHDAALPKHITTSIIDYFNNNRLKYLFCTSTIIEGVNTSAKNVIYFDAKKGKDIPIDYFDYSNIKGRAGRMMEHYIGNIYNFNQPPQKEEINVDIPFFQQNPVKDEVLIQLDEQDIRNKNSEQYFNIRNIPNKIKAVIKKNGLSVKGQLCILDQLRKDIKNNPKYICWSGIKPKKKYLDYILKLAWDYLQSESESRTITFKQLAYLTHAYGVWGTSIKNIIEDHVKYLTTKNHKNIITEEELIQYEDQSIKLILQVVRHWFEYKVPKFLSTINSLQTIVCDEVGIAPGDYSQFASIIENDFIPNHLTILAEYGIPHSAIKKISRIIPSNIDDEDLIPFIKSNKLHLTASLITYEKDKLASLL